MEIKTISVLFKKMGVGKKPRQFTHWYVSILILVREHEGTGSQRYGLSGTEGSGGDAWVQAYGGSA